MHLHPAFCWASSHRVGPCLGCSRVPCHCSLAVFHTTMPCETGLKSCLLSTSHVCANDGLNRSATYSSKSVPKTIAGLDTCIASTSHITVSPYHPSLSKCCFLVVPVSAKITYQHNATHRSIEKTRHPTKRSGAHSRLHLPRPRAIAQRLPGCYNYRLECRCNAIMHRALKSFQRKTTNMHLLCRNIGV